MKDKTCMTCGQPLPAEAEGKAATDPLGAALEAFENGAPLATPDRLSGGIDPTLPLNGDPLVDHLKRSLGIQ